MNVYGRAFTIFCALLFAVQCHAAFDAAYTGTDPQAALRLRRKRKILKLSHRA
jgi:hypothetical protein